MKLLTEPRAGMRTDRPLGSRIQAELEAMIAGGALEPGGRLNEVMLARQLGVSRGPIREAARALERLGLVTIIMNRGAFVRTIGIDEALETYELNSVLFGFGASRAAALATGAEALELRGCVEVMERAVEHADGDEFFRHNAAFHEGIMRLARNRQAADLYRDQLRKIHLLRRRSFERTGNMAQSNLQHRGILEAIMTGDAELARRRAEEHTRAGRARFLVAIDYGTGTASQPLDAGRSS